MRETAEHRAIGWRAPPPRLEPSRPDGVAPRWVALTWSPRRPGGRMRRAVRLGSRRAGPPAPPGALDGVDGLADPVTARNLREMLRVGRLRGWPGGGGFDGA